MTLTYGEYGGRYVPETLIPALEELEAGWRDAQADPAFAAELDELARTYAGRPTPLTRAERFAPTCTYTSSAKTCSTRARTS